MDLSEMDLKVRGVLCDSTEGIWCHARRNANRYNVPKLLALRKTQSAFGHCYFNTRSKN